MSTALARLLGIPFRPIECSIGTAKVGGKLTVRGIAANIRISLRADLVCNLRQVLVIDDLSGDLNLGYHFLRSVKGTLQFRSTGTTLQIAGTSIPLIQQLNLNNPPEEIAPAAAAPAAAAPAAAAPAAAAPAAAAAPWRWRGQIVWRRRRWIVWRRRRWIVWR